MPDAMRDTAGAWSSWSEKILYMMSTAATARWQQGGNEAMRWHRQSGTATSDVTRKQGGR
eukprot:scaffold8836_cov62-Phaeocystis_antarctica.AAC.10